jgi:hypothetical protein
VHEPRNQLLKAFVSSSLSSPLHRAVDRQGTTSWGEKEILRTSASGISTSGKEGSSCRKLSKGRLNDLIFVSTYHCLVSISCLFLSRPLKIVLELFNLFFQIIIKNTPGWYRLIISRKRII